MSRLDEVIRKAKSRLGDDEKKPSKAKKCYSKMEKAINVAIDRQALL
jgi:hypothetical protein